MRQFAGAGRDVHIARSLDKLAQDTEGLCRVFEGVPGQQCLPFRLGALELARKGRQRLALFLAGVQHSVEDAAHIPGVGLARRFKLLERGEAHQARQALAGRLVGGDGVRLQVVFHLQAVLDVAEKAVGRGELPGFILREQLVLGQLSQAGKRLGALEERLPPGLQHLQRLGYELDLADAASSELHIADHLVALEHIAFDAAFHGHDLPQYILVDGPRIAEGLDHLQKLRCQRSVSRHAARLDQHHPLPGLTPLRVVILVAGERTGQRPRIPLGPQPQINPVERAFRRHAAHLGDECLGQAVEELMVGQHRARSLALAGQLLENASLLAIDE